MKILSLTNVIKLMIVIGVIAIFAVVVQSCQSSNNEGIIRVSEKTLDIDEFRTGSLEKLKALQAPPVQPATKFVNGTGKTMELSDFKGRFVLLNVWATWCAPCVIEMPSLNAIAQEFGGDDFAVITISMDQTDAAIDGFFEKHNFGALTRWRDSGLNLASKLGARGLPITVIYNPEGDEMVRVLGEADWTSDEAKALIGEILGRE